MKEIPIAMKNSPAPRPSQFTSTARFVERFSPARFPSPTWSQFLSAATKGEGAVAAVVGPNRTDGPVDPATGQSTRSGVLPVGWLLIEPSDDVLFEARRLSHYVQHDHGAAPTSGRGFEALAVAPVPDAGYL